MTEPVVEPVEEVVVAPTEGEPELTPFTPTEQEAYDQGWRPKDEFKGDESDWRPAKEWLDRGSLFKKIDSVQRDNSELRQALQGLYQNWNAATAANYERARASLIQERRAALKQGDLEQVAQLEEKIDQVDAFGQQANQQRQPRGAPPVVPEFKEFVDKNPWYLNNRKMRIYAETVANDVAQQHQGQITPGDLLKRVDREVRDQFPDYFKRAPTGPASPDGSGNQGRQAASGGKAVTTYADRERGLSELEQKIYTDLVKTKTVTKEKFWQDYDSVRRR